jgi:hypothetical protein
MYDWEDPPTKAEAEFEMFYPIQLKNTLSIKDGVMYEVDTSEVSPGKFETMLFPSVKHANGQWVTAHNNSLKYVGKQFWNDKKSALEYHKSWLDYFNGHAKQPEHERL